MREVTEEIEVTDKKEEVKEKEAETENNEIMYFFVN